MVTNGLLMLVTSLALVASAPASAEQFICTVTASSDAGRESYVIDIDRKARSISVVDAKTKTPFPISVVQLDNDKAIFAFSSIRFDAKTGKIGKAKPTNYTVHSGALIEFRSNSMVVAGGVLDASGREISLDELHAAKDKEAREAARSNREPLNHPMFWDMLGIAVYSKRGSCAAYAPNG